MTRSFLLNASAFLLAASATIGTFGGNAALARHQFATAERIAGAAAPAPLKALPAAPRSRHA